MLHKPHQYPLSLNQIVHSDLEITTPILSLNSSNPWDRELEKVLHLMTSGNFRSTVNNTVGMHVHVGLSSGTHFPLPAIKKVVAVVILAEPALDRFHPESRRCVRAYNKTLRFQPPPSLPVRRAGIRHDLCYLPSRRNPAPHFYGHTAPIRAGERGGEENVRVPATLGDAGDWRGTHVGGWGLC